MAKGEWRGTLGFRASTPGGHRVRSRADRRAPGPWSSTRSPPSGYKKHEADLNDGGIWVVNGKLGWSGRLNKPINQLDGVVPSPEGKTRLDVVQDGAAVVTLNLNAGRGQAIETSRLESQDGGSAAVPTVGDVRMAGGTLATVDAETGEVWAVRYDAELGKPVMTAVDRQAEPLAEAGEGAALAVSQDGTVVVTSAEEGTVTTLAAAGRRVRASRRPRTCPATPARSPTSPRSATAS